MEGVFISFLTDARVLASVSTVYGKFQVRTLPLTGVLVVNARSGLHHSHGTLPPWLSLSLSHIPRLTSAYAGFSDLRLSANPRSLLFSMTMLTSALIPSIYEFQSTAQLYMYLCHDFSWEGRDAH